MGGLKLDSLCSYGGGRGWPEVEEDDGGSHLSVKGDRGDDMSRHGELWSEKKGFGPAKKNVKEKETKEFDIKVFGNIFFFLSSIFHPFKPLKLSLNPNSLSKHEYNNFETIQVLEFYFYP